MKQAIERGDTVYSLVLDKAVYNELMKLQTLAGVRRSDFIREAIYEKMAREKKKYCFKSINLNPFKDDYITIKKSDLNEIVLRSLLQLKKKMP